MQPSVRKAKIHFRRGKPGQWPPYHQERFETPSLDRCLRKGPPETAYQQCFCHSSHSASENRHSPTTSSQARTQGDALHGNQLRGLARTCRWSGLLRHLGKARFRLESEIEAIVLVDHRRTTLGKDFEIEQPDTESVDSDVSEVHRILNTPESPIVA